MPAGNQATQIIFLIVIAGAFYFLLIRPQQQQQKRQRTMVASLQIGTEIMTIGGIYATIVEVEEDRLRVRVADGSELEIAKRAVASVIAGGDETVDESDDVSSGSDTTDDLAEVERHADASGDTSKDSASDA